MSFPSTEWRFLPESVTFYRFWHLFKISVFSKYEEWFYSSRFLSGAQDLCLKAIPSIYFSVKYFDKLNSRKCHGWLIEVTFNSWIVNPCRGFFLMDPFLCTNQKAVSSWFTLPLFLIVDGAKRRPVLLTVSSKCLTHLWTKWFFVTGLLPSYKFLAKSTSPLHNHNPIIISTIFTSEWMWINGLTRRPASTGIFFARIQIFWSTFANS